MTTIETSRLVLATGLSLGIQACGSEAPPSSANGSDYFPLVDGAVSVYEHSSKGGWTETVTLTQTSSGHFREEDTENPDGERNESVLELDSKGRVYRTSKRIYQQDVLDTSIEYEPGFIRFDPAWLDLDVNESMRQTYDRTETKIGEDPDPTRPRAHVYTSFGYQSITVLGTAYTDCLVIHRERDYEDSQGDAEDQKKQFYLCPGVGKVQEVNIDSGNTELLVSYSE
jgi:hypothetical protein